MRTKTDDTTRAPAEHVAVRLDAEVIARLDALIPAFTTEWLEANRSHVLRAVIMRGLPQVEVDPLGKATEGAEHDAAAGCERCAAGVKLNRHRRG